MARLLTSILVIATFSSAANTCNIYHIDITVIQIIIEVILYLLIVMMAGNVINIVITVMVDIYTAKK